MNIIYYEVTLQQLQLCQVDPTLW